MDTVSRVGVITANKIAFSEEIENMLLSMTKKSQDTTENVASLDGANGMLDESYFTSPSTSSSVNTPILII